MCLFIKGIPSIALSTDRRGNFSTSITWSLPHFIIVAILKCRKWLLRRACLWHRVKACTMGHSAVVQSPPRA